MRVVHSIGFATALLALAGCQSTTRAVDRSIPKSLAGKSVVYTTQATVGPCAIQPVTETGIVASFFASAIAHGVSKIGSSLKAAGSSETVSVSTQRNLELSTTRSFGPCIIVARGWFHRSKPTDKKRGARYVANEDSAFDTLRPTQVKSDDPEEWAAQKLHDVGLWLAEAPDFYFEGNFRPAIEKGENKSIALNPRYAYLGEPISSSAIRREKERHVTLSFAFSKIGTGKNLSKGEGASLILGKLISGNWTEYPINPSEETTENSELEITYCQGGTASCPSTFSQKVRSPWESSWFMVALSDATTPYTLQALVTETRKESAFLKFVGAAFSGAEESITEQLQQAIIPSIGDTASITEQGAIDAAVKKHSDAKVAANTKLTACIATPTDFEARESAFGAVTGVNAAFAEVKKLSVSGSFFSFDKSLISTLKSAALGDPTGRACTMLLGELTK